MTKKQRATRLFPSLLICFLISFLVGRWYQQHLSNSNNHNEQPSDRPTHPQDQVISTNSRNMQLILKPREDSLYDLVLKTTLSEKVIDQVMYVREVVWAPDGSAVAISSGSASTGYHIELIRCITGEKIDTKEQNDIFDNLKGSYSHVHSSIFEWRNPNQLVISVSAISDTKQNKNTTQYYLVDALTGEIIKKIL